MRIQDFHDLLDTHGADPARWPPQQRAAALALRDRLPEAQAAWAEAERMEVLLRSRPRETPQDRLRAATVIAATMAQLRVETARPDTGPWHRLWQEWRWLFARPIGVGLAGMVLAGWFAGQGGAWPSGQDALLELLLADPLSLFEEDGQ